MAVNVSLVRDTKWLTLEVCREFQRGTCSRSDAECKFAHPSRSCHVENGRVIACFDSLKVRTVTRALPQLPCFSFPCAWLGAQGCGMCRTAVYRSVSAGRMLLLPSRLTLTSAAIACSARLCRQRGFYPGHFSVLAQVWYSCSWNRERRLWAANEIRGVGRAETQFWVPRSHQLCIWCRDLKCAFNEQKQKQHFKIINQLHTYFLETELQMHFKVVL